MDDPAEHFQPKSLKIVAPKGASLSKNQQAFNRLTKKIQSLEVEIAKETARLEKVFAAYHTELTPLRRKIGKALLETAMAAGAIYKKFKFTQRQQEEVQLVILELCNQGFAEVEPTDEEKAFHDEWSEVTYDEEMKRQSQEMKDQFGEFMNDFFDIDVDMDEFETDQEGFANFQEKLQEEFAKKQAQEEAFNRGRKKTKKQLENEAAKKAEEDLKNKSVRSVYIALAKVLHPDAEANETVRQEKEEIMKKVTAAYENQDLATLLKLEMEWVDNTAGNLEKLSEDKLKLYVSALKQQVADLTQQKARIFTDPKYFNIVPLMYISEYAAFASIKNSKIDFENGLKALKQMVQEINAAKSKKNYLKIIDGLGNQIYKGDEDFYDVFFDEDEDI